MGSAVPHRSDPTVIWPMSVPTWPDRRSVDQNKSIQAKFSSSRRSMSSSGVWGWPE